MGARACDNLSIRLDKCIRFACERCDLDRKLTFKPLGGARADGGKAFGNTFEGRQAEAHLEGRGQQQYDRQNAKRGDKRTVEAVYLLVDLRSIARDGNEITSLISEIDGALNDAQPLALGPFCITLPRAALGR